MSEKKARMKRAEKKLPAGPDAGAIPIAYREADGTITGGDGAKIADSCECSWMPDGTVVYAAAFRGL